MTPRICPPAGAEKKNGKQYCARCKAPLTADEIGATKKLVNRGTKTYFCLGCLGKAFEVSREDLEEKIRYFKEMGCTLFT